MIVVAHLLKVYLGVRIRQLCHVCCIQLENALNGPAHRLNAANPGALVGFVEFLAVD